MTTSSAWNGICLSSSSYILPWPSQNGQGWAYPFSDYPKSKSKFCRLNSSVILETFILFILHQDICYNFPLFLVLNQQWEDQESVGLVGWEKQCFLIQLKTYFYVAFSWYWMMATHLDSLTYLEKCHYKFLGILFLSLNIKLCPYACTCAWVCALGVGDRSIGFPRVGVTGSCEPSNLGTRNCTQALWQNTNHS